MSVLLGRVLSATLRANEPHCAGAGCALHYSEREGKGLAGVPPAGSRVKENRAMARRLIEELSGAGDIYSGDVLLRAGVPYQLSVWSDDVQPPPAVTIEGAVGITGIAEAVVLTGPDKLTLKLPDGRSVALKLTSTGGRFVASGFM